jgi:arylsulfatase A-like enzyme
MSRYLRVLPFAVLPPAALDTWLVRRSFADYRDPSFALFLQSVLLWSALGILALVPAYLGGRLVARLWRTERNHAARDGAVLLGWTVLPVAAHTALDTFTDLGAQLSELAQPSVALSLAGVAVGILLASQLAGRLLQTLPTKYVAVAVATLSIVAGGLATVAGGSAAGTLDSDRSVGAGERPNVLLIVWDTTRSPSLGLYGYGRGTTSGLDEFAAGSLVFDRARSASRFTLTSHLSMLTGTYPSHHGASLIRQTVDVDRTPSVASMLRRAGYRTGGFVGTSVLRARSGMQFGFEEYDDLVDPPVCDTVAWHFVHDLQRVCSRTVPGMWFNGQPHWFQDFQRAAPEVLGNALDWIRADDPRPWFCMINLYDVHWPYLPSSEARREWVGPYGGPVNGYVFRKSGFPEDYDLSAADDAHLRDLYDAEMWQLDRRVAAFLSELDLDTTAVVLTSDHGEAFGEGDKYGHDDILEPQVRVPLLVRTPGAGAPDQQRRVDPVSGVDVAPTILALAGLEAPAHMLGRDLLGAPFPADRAVLVEDRDHWNPSDVRIALYSGDWKLVRLGRDGEELTYRLYDLAHDSIGVEDVASEHPGVLAELTSKLAQLRGLWDERSDMDGPTDIDEGALRVLGYL